MEMELTKEQYIQFHKNPEINPFTGRKIQKGKKIYQQLLTASEKYVNFSDRKIIVTKDSYSDSNSTSSSSLQDTHKSKNNEPKNVWMIIEENVDNRPELVYQQCVGLFYDLDLAYCTLFRHVFDNLRYSLNDFPGIVQHYLSDIEVDTNVELDRLSIHISDELLEAANMYEKENNPSKWRHLLISDSK